MNKYHNIKTEIDNIVFHSKREAARYRELKLLVSAGVIKDLVLQPKFVLLDKGVTAYGTKYGQICYIADFMYYDIERGYPVVEDSKGFKTTIYSAKKKLFMARYPNLRLLEV